MSPSALTQIVLFIVLLLALAWPIGTYMARVFRGTPTPPGRWLGPLERAIWRAAGLRLAESGAPAEMTWREYARAVLAFGFAGVVAVYLLMRAQQWLPGNPQGLSATSPDLAFDTAISFVTNTDWQSYGGETTLSYLPQMLGLGVQNFVSAATGLSVMVALARGLWRK